MIRTPKVVLGNAQLTVTLADTSYTVPDNQVLTLSAFTLNNTTGTARTVTIHVIPSGGAAGVANQMVTTVSVPPAASGPIIVSSLVGHHIASGGKLQMLADAATAVTPLVSGYLTTV